MHFSRKSVKRGTTVQIQGGLKFVIHKILVVVKDLWSHWALGQGLCSGRCHV